MNPFNLMVKGMSLVFDAYADGLKIMAHQVNFLVKDPSGRDPQIDQKADKSPADSEGPQKPEKEHEQPSGDTRKTKPSLAPPTKETKKASPEDTTGSSKPASQLARKETSKPKATSKSRPETDTGKVYRIISRSPKGVTVDDLSKESGFDRQKIYGIVSRLKKQDKIKSPQKGFYKKT